MEVNAKLDLVGTLDAVLIRGDGSHRDLGRISDATTHRLIGRPVQWWRALWRKLRQSGIIPITMGFAAFLALYAVVDQPRLMEGLLQDPRVLAVIMAAPPLGLVVTDGMNFLASDMAAGLASPRISSMNYHDSGTGTTAATSVDAGLETAAGPTTRATGAQTNPALNQYRSVGTINYTTTLSITEWGLFNQAARGAGSVLWDHRTFGVISVVNLDSITFTYSLTLTAGGT